MYKRVIIKLSGEALSDGENRFDENVIKKISEQIKILNEKGTQTGIVVGGGNFWRGRSANPLMDRCAADSIGMLATVMNALYLCDFFRREGMKAAVMTPFAVGSMTELFSKEKALAYFGENSIVIFAGGIGCPYFSTDTVTALRACELEADAILFAKNIDGVYDSDPALNPGAVKFDNIPCRDIVEKNLKVIDISAASLCLENKIPVMIFALSEENSIVRTADGENTGTMVTV